jgi:hypothetical protein
MMILLLCACIASADADRVKLPRPAPAAVVERVDQAAGVVVIRRGEIAVVESSAAITVICSPDRALKITDLRLQTPKGAINLGGPFCHQDAERPYSGDPRDERRTYEADRIFLVQPGYAGDCELIVFHNLTGKVERQKFKVETDAKPDEPPGPKLTELGKRIKSAYDADTSADKASELDAVIAVYSSMSTLAETAGDVATAFQRLIETGKEKKATGKLLGVQ